MLYINSEEDDMKFLFGKTTKRRSRRPTTEEKEKRLSLKESQSIHEKYLKRLESNEELMDEAIAKKYGIKIKEPDPIEQKRKRFEEKATDLALGRLDEDSEFADQMAQGVADRIVGEMYDNKRRHKRSFLEEDHYGSDNPFRAALEQMKDMKDFQDEMGVSGGGGGMLSTILTALLNSEVGKDIAHTFLQRAQEQLPAQFPPQSLPRAGPPLPPMPAPTSLKEPPPREPKAPQEAPTAEIEEEPVQVPQMPDLTGFMPYLDGEPALFVEELNGSADAGMEWAILMLEILRSKTAEEIMEWLQPLRAENPDVEELVSQLEENSEWLEEVMRIVKGEVVEE